MEETILRRLQVIADKTADAVVVFASWYTEAEITHILKCLRQLLAAIIWVLQTKSILMFFYCETEEIYREFHKRYRSGQLAKNIARLFRILGHAADLSASVTIYNVYGMLM